ncbi:MAG: hypothetical protein Kow0069_29260 [Promethearchaeota archaeon]
MRLSRPFTLLYPAVAVVSGVVLAAGLGWPPGTPAAWLRVASATVAAPLLNAASNAANQAFDVEEDRINKPDRPIPRGDLTTRQAAWFSAGTSAAAFGLASLASTSFLLLCGVGLAFSLLYSAPPARLKRLPWVSNAALAVPRGLLLPVAGWVVLAPVAEKTPWVLASASCAFVFGANSAKDFSDAPGDEACGVVTLPVLLGPERAARAIAPFFVAPFLAVPLFCAVGLLPWAFSALALLALPGGWAALQLVRAPDKAAMNDNHPAWKAMYLVAVGYVAGAALLGFVAGAGGGA